MFVRWRESRRTRRYAAARGMPDGPDVHIAAVLGRWMSMRVDGVRGYKFVKYLGSYYASDGAAERAAFRDRCVAKLDELAISPEDRAMAIAAIASRLRPRGRRGSNEASPLRRA